MDTLVAFTGKAWASIEIKNTGVKLVSDSIAHIVPQGGNAPVELMIDTNGIVKISNTLEYSGAGNNYIRVTMPILLA